MTSNAKNLQLQFGNGCGHISEKAMDALLNYSDTSCKVTLLQFVEVTDIALFTQYETAITEVLGEYDAAPCFSSEVFAHMLSDRTFTSIRGITFKNILVLLDVINSPDFTRAMNMLFSATSNNICVLGRPLDLPFESGGTYSDPKLKDLTKEDAIKLLEGVEDAAELLHGNDKNTSIDNGKNVVIDMIVSDNTSPFWMANLIKFHDKAQYPDKRKSSLTGKEANMLYAETVMPLLMEYSSLPELVMEIDIVLTNEDIQWNEAVLNRYASRDAFLNIFPLNTATNEAIIHKVAGVADTLVLATEKRNGKTKVR